MDKIKDLLQSAEYDFLRKDNNLKNIILLTCGGSHAYGMNNENSDVDIRGVALNSSREILLGTDFEQVIDVETDTTVYSFNKLIQLLTSCNPNTIEILGCRPDQYFVKTDVGAQLLSNRKMFLSKVCIHTFGGYASSQLRRLENKSNRLVGQAQNEAYILKSIQNAAYDFKHRYTEFKESDFLKLYTGASDQPEMESEIFFDISLHNYPLRDWAGMWNEMKAIVSSYTKIGKRNAKAISHDKLGKHMAHLIRLYMMCIDILEKEEIITYRSEEHDLLMKIRNGEFLDDNRQPTAEFYDLLNEYESRFDYACKHTSLPDKPNYDKINEFKMSVNADIVKSVDE